MSCHSLNHQGSQVCPVKKKVASEVSQVVVIAAGTGYNKQGDYFCKTQQEMLTGLQL
jgi:hypothetical protein